jgi:polyhydroxybutyrate depolymerase
MRGRGAGSRRTWTIAAVVVLVCAVALVVVLAGSTSGSGSGPGTAPQTAALADATAPTVAASAPSEPPQAPAAALTRPAPVIYRPANLSKAKPVPLVIGLHASGGYPSTFETTSGLDAVANQHGFVVAYLGAPEPTSPAWTLTQMPQNLAYVKAEIESLTISQNIDPTRVYVTGFSAGATMAYFVGCQLSEHVDAIAPVSGSMRFTDKCKVTHPISEMEIIGTADAIPLEGTSRLLSAAQVAAKWRAFDGCSSHASTETKPPVNKETWDECTGSSGVELDIIQGGKHEWPGSPEAVGPDAQFNAAQAVWAFFAAHPGTLQLVAKLHSLKTRVHHRARLLSVSVSLNEPVQARLSLFSAGHTVATGTYSLPASKKASASLPIPSQTSSGRYTAEVVLRDSAGAQQTFTRTVSVPKAPH